MKKAHIIQDSWIWNKTVEEFVKDKIKGKSLNVCAGKSKLGTVKLDLDPADKTIIRGDMIKLPFADESFDTVIQDPPWKIGYYQRMKPFFECVRVCKIGGRIIYNAYWIPTSKMVKLEEAHIRRDTEWGNTSIISIFKRTQ